MDACVIAFDHLMRLCAITRQVLPKCFVHLILVSNDYDRLLALMVLNIDSCMLMSLLARSAINSNVAVHGHEYCKNRSNDLC